MLESEQRKPYGGGTNRNIRLNFVNQEYWDSFIINYSLKIH